MPVKKILGVKKYENTSKRTREKKIFDGTGARMDGWTGGTGYQKCPLNFFILCGYIDYVYDYLYTK